MKKVITSVLFFSLFLVFFAYGISPNLQVKKIVLENGFTVFLNEDHSTSEVYGTILIKSGGANDPEDLTGVAHFLEHMLFKGTDKLGTIDYQNEKPLLDQIASLYDKFYEIRTGDENILQREQLYKKINELSKEASKYVVTNEFSSLLNSIGAKNINASTGYDHTEYYSSFPANQIEKWLEIYSHAISNPVFRMYQAEHEVIKEEKNRSLSNHNRHFSSEVRAIYFKDNIYAKHDLIGDIEHIPFITPRKLREYYETYYVANNMALFLSGDFKSEEIIPIIREKFSVFKNKPLPKRKEFKDREIKRREFYSKQVYGYDRGVMIFRAVNPKDKDFDKFLIIKNLLYNSKKVGLLNKYVIDENIDNVAISAWSGLEGDGFFIYYWVKPGKFTFAKIESVILESLEKIKKGEFSEELFDAAKLDLKLSFYKDLEDIKDRIDCMIESYLFDIGWEEYLKSIDKISEITKEDVVNIAKKYFSDKYIIFNTVADWDGTKIKKISSLPFEKMPSNKNSESSYAKNFLAIQAKEQKPIFIDYNKDVEIKNINNNSKLYYSKNNINNIFELELVFNYGGYFSKSLGIVLNFFERIAPIGMSIDEFRIKMASLGVSYKFRGSDQFTNITLEGPEENLEKAIDLLVNLIENANPDEKELKKYKKEIFSYRRNEENDLIPGRALIAYIKYGKESEYLKRLKNSELNKLKAVDLINEFKNLTKNIIAVNFTGFTSSDRVVDLLKKKFKFLDGEQNKNIIINFRPYFKPDKNIVYFYNSYNKNLGYIYMFFPFENIPIDEYYKLRAFEIYFCGEGLNGILFKEIREYRSLAYSIGGEIDYEGLNKTGGLYIGASYKMDKVNDIIEVMDSVIKNMPTDSISFSNIKNSLINEVYLSKPFFRDIPSKVFYNELQGLSKDPNEDFYNQYRNLKLDDIFSFYNKYIVNSRKSFLIIGSTDFINNERVQAIGPMQELRKEILYKTY